MATIRVFHWKEEEAKPLLQAVQDAGHDTVYDRRFSKPTGCDAVVIDLTRLPSHGLEVATALRNAKATRRIPLIFVDGLPEKVEAIRTKLPDAAYTTRARLQSALNKALAKPPKEPVVPPAMMDRFKDRTAAQKLGIRENCRVAVIDPPRDYAQVIGSLPAGAALEESSVTPGDVTLWFVTNPETYLEALPSRREWAARTKLWVLWPKKTSIKENQIRDAGLEMGLVDYKVCSVNATWSALLFARRKQ